MKPLRASFALTVTIALVACGSRTPLAIGDSSGPGGVGGDDENGGATSGDGAAGGGLLPPGATRFGVVAMSTTDQGGASAWADFQKAGSPYAACDYFGAVGSCEVVNCLGQYLSTVDGGPISIASADGASTATTTYMAAAYPDTSFEGPGVFDTGAIVQFLGEGANGVPRLMTTAVVPSFAELTTPSSTTVTRVDTAEDFAVTWPPLAVGDASVIIGPSPPSDVAPSVFCIFDGAAGNGAIPHAALQTVREGTLSGEVSIVFSPITRSVTTIGPWAINSIAFVGPGAQSEVGTIILE